jgi:hypothetical protein
MARKAARTSPGCAWNGPGKRTNYAIATCASALPREADQQMRDGLVTERE